MAGEFSYLSTDANDMSAASFAYYSCGAAGLAYKTCKAKNLDLASQDSEPLLRYMDSLIGDHYPDPDSRPLPIKADGKQIFRWLEEGDPVAERIYTEFISSLRQVIHNIQITVGPDLIALGGGLSLTPRLLPDLQQSLDRYYQETKLDPVLQASIVRCHYQSEGNVLGAMANFLATHPEMNEAT